MHRKRSYCFERLAKHSDLCLPIKVRHYSRSAVSSVCLLFRVLNLREIKVSNILSAATVSLGSFEAPKRIVINPEISVRNSLIQSTSNDEYS